MGRVPLLRTNKREGALRATARRPPSLRSRWLPRLAVTAAGAAWVAVFPAPNLGWLAWVLLVPALLIIRGSPTPREAFLRGWWAGMGYLAGVLYWLAPNVTAFFPLIVAGVGLLWAPWGMLVRLWLHPPVRLGRGLAGLVGVPAGWVLIETARSWQWLGGPWALVGTSQWRHPAVLGLASLGGVWLVSFAVVMVNTAVSLLLGTAGLSVRLVACLAAVAALAAGPVWYLGHAPHLDGRRLRVGLIQTGVVIGPQRRLAVNEALTRRLVPAHPDLVVWGESSVSYDMTARPALRATLDGLARDAHGQLLVNVDSLGHSIHTKRAVLIGAHGILAQYEKTRLVPFGEYIPFDGELGWLNKVTKSAPVNMTHGHGAAVIHDGRLTFGPLISFEALFPDMARVEAREGARVIVYQLNVSSFQHSWAPDQQATVGPLRAAETGRPVVQAAATGVSFSFDARGRPLAPLIGRGRRDAQLVTVPLATTVTPYDRWGNYVPACAALLLFLLLGAAAAARVARMNAARRTVAQRRPAHPTKP